MFKYLQFYSKKKIKKKISKKKISKKNLKKVHVELFKKPTSPLVRVMKVAIHPTNIKKLEATSKIGHRHK